MKTVSSQIYPHWSPAQVPSSCVLLARKNLTPPGQPKKLLTFAVMQHQHMILRRGFPPGFLAKFIIMSCLASTVSRLLQWLSAYHTCLSVAVLLCSLLPSVSVLTQACTYTPQPLPSSWSPPPLLTLVKELLIWVPKCSSPGCYLISWDTFWQRPSISTCGS